MGSTGLPSFLLISQDLIRNVYVKVVLHKRVSPTALNLSQFYSELRRVRRSNSISIDRTCTDKLGMGSTALSTLSLISQNFTLHLCIKVVFAIAARGTKLH